MGANHVLFLLRFVITQIIPELFLNGPPFQVELVGTPFELLVDTEDGDLVRSELIVASFEQSLSQLVSFFM